MYLQKILTATFIASMLLLSACGGSSDTKNTIEETNDDRNEGQDEANNDADESTNDAEDDRDEARDDANETNDNSAIDSTNYVYMASIAWDASLSGITDSRRMPLNDIPVGATSTVINETIDCSSNGNINVEIKRANFDIEDITAGDFDDINYNDCAFSIFSTIKGGHKVTYNSSFTLSDSDDVLPEYPIEEGDTADLDIEFNNYSLETSDITIEINGVVSESISNAAEDSIDINSDNFVINTSTDGLNINAQYTNLQQSQRRNISASTYTFSQDFLTTLQWTLDDTTSTIDVNFETVQDFSGMFSGSAEDISYSTPSSGEALITSDEGNIKIVVESTSVVQISFDSDKDGNYDLVENIDSEEFFGDEPTFLIAN